MARALGATLPLKLQNNGWFGTNYNLIQQIKSNLVNLILTKKGERCHQPEFGCDIWKYLFEPITPTTTQQAYAALVKDVEYWMPFLEIVTLDLTNSNENIDNQIIRMNVQFRVRSNPNLVGTINLTL